MKASRCLGITFLIEHSPRGGRCKHKGSCLYLVRNYRIFTSMKLCYALYTDNICTGTLYISPILFKKLATYYMGLLCAFSSVVCPSAKHADSITLIVAPTLDSSKYIDVPSSLSAEAQINPCSIFTSDPRASNPFICLSIGLLPMLQPPGSATCAFILT